MRMSVPRATFEDFKSGFLVDIDGKFCRMFEMVQKVNKHKLLKIKQKVKKKMILNVDELKFRNLL